MYLHIINFFNAVFRMRNTLGFLSENAIFCSDNIQLHHEIYRHYLLMVKLIVISSVNYQSFLLKRMNDEVQHKRLLRERLRSHLCFMFHAPNADWTLAYGTFHKQPGERPVCLKGEPFLLTFFARLCRKSKNSIHAVVTPLRGLTTRSAGHFTSAAPLVRVLVSLAAIFGFAERSPRGAGGQAPLETVLTTAKDVQQLPTGVRSYFQLARARAEHLSSQTFCRWGGSKV